jgi:hypothetical protein
MVDTKTQRNKSDKETIIDMEPVKEQQKLSFFKTNNFILPLISVLFFVLISTWLILDYLPNFFQEHTNRINDLANTIQKIDEKENKKINILNQEIEILKNEIKNFDLNRNEEAKIEIKDLQKSLLLIKEELKKISTKLIVLEKGNKQVFDKKDETKNKVPPINSDKNKINFSKKSENLTNKENELIIEAKSIVEKLLARKDLESFSNEELNLIEQSYFEKIKNYLAGFFKLRQYSNDMSPRGLITKAELELESRNLYNFLSLIKKLPDNWKKPAKDFILKLESFLKIIDKKSG